MPIQVFVQTFPAIVEDSPFFFRFWRGREQVRRVLFRFFFGLPALSAFDFAVVREDFRNKLKVVRVLVRRQLWRVAVRIESSVVPVHFLFSFPPGVRLLLFFFGSACLALLCRVVFPIFCSMFFAFSEFFSIFFVSRCFPDIFTEKNAVCGRLHQGIVFCVHFRRSGKIV